MEVESYCQERIDSTKDFLQLLRREGFWAQVAKLLSSQPIILNQAD